MFFDIVVCFVGFVVFVSNSDGSSINAGGDGWK